MADRFDAIACEALGLVYGTDTVAARRVAAALRSTDAKAREDCARIAEKAYRTFTFDGADERYRILADQVEHIAAAIRSPEPEAGAEECGTCDGLGFVPEECEVCCNPCDEYGTIEHGKGCYVAEVDGGGSTNVDPPVPCPACKPEGGDDAEVVCHLCGGTFPLCDGCLTEREV